MLAHFVERLQAGGPLLFRLEQVESGSILEDLAQLPGLEPDGLILQRLAVGRLPASHEPEVAAVRLGRLILTPRLRDFGEVLAALHLRERLIDLLARRLLLIAGRVRGQGDGDGAHPHRGGLRPPGRLLVLVLLRDLASVRFRVLRDLGVARRGLVAEHEGVEPDPGDGDALVLRGPGGLHLVVRDVGARDGRLDDLAAEQVAAVRLLEARDAHSVAVLDQPLVVVEVELAILLELRAPGDGVGHLGVADPDAEIVGLLRDQLLIDEALEGLRLEIVLLRVVGRVLAPAHRRHLAEAIRVGLREVARRHQLAVDSGGPRLRRPRAEPRRATPEREDEGEDDRAENQGDQ